MCAFRSQSVKIAFAFAVALPHFTRVECTDARANASAIKKLEIFSISCPGHLRLHMGNDSVDHTHISLRLYLRRTCEPG